MITSPLVPLIPWFQTVNCKTRHHHDGFEDPDLPVVLLSNIFSATFLERYANSLAMDHLFLVNLCYHNCHTLLILWKIDSSRDRTVLVRCNRHLHWGKLECLGSKKELGVMKFIVFMPALQCH
jgi:hypothetical protein